MIAKKSGFASNVLLLASGTVLSQLISLLAAPITARLFSPFAFGVAAVFAAFTGVVLPVVCLRYENSILLPEKEEEAVNALGLSLATVVGTTLLVGLFTSLFQHTLINYFHSPELQHYLWMIPLSIFAGGAFLPLSMWSVRTERFGLLTLTQVLGVLVAVGVQVGAGLSGHVTAGWLIGASLAGTAVGTALLAAQTVRESPGLITHYLRFSGIWYALKRYQRFPRYSSGATVLNGLSWQLPVFFLSSFFTEEVVGQFSLGNRVIRAPMNLVGGSIAKVFAQRASEARHNQVLAETVEKVLRYLVILTLFPCLLLSLIGKDLFIVVFSAKWAEAGVYSQILSPWVCVWFISSPLSLVFVVLEEQRLEFGINVLILVSRFLSLLIGGLSGSPRVALALFSSSGVLVYGYYCLAILSKSGVPAGNAFRILISHLLMFVPAGIVILLLQWLSVPPIVILAAALLLVMIYYAFVLYGDAEARQALTGLLHSPLLRMKILGLTPSEAQQRTPSKELLRSR